MVRGFVSIALLCAASLALSGCIPNARGWAVAYKDQQSPKYRIIMPSDAPSISQEFFDAENKPGHDGIDVVAPVGSPVIAAADGTVTQSYFEPMYGNRLVISHGGNWVTVYKHLQSRIAEPGTRVARGEKIATLGATGTLAGGFPHLHFELRRGSAVGTAVDPHRFWADGPGRVTCYSPEAPIPASNAIRLTYPAPCQ